MSTLNIFLQAKADGGMQNLIILVMMILVFWLFMIRPQAKKAKEQKKFADSIASGEKVITTAGIHGIISRTKIYDMMQYLFCIGYA